jgi:hypothetical protein
MGQRPEFCKNLLIWNMSDRLAATNDFSSSVAESVEVSEGIAMEMGLGFTEGRNSRTLSSKGSGQAET